MACSGLLGVSRVSLTKHSQVVASVQFCFRWCWLMEMVSDIVIYLVLGYISHQQQSCMDKVIRGSASRSLR
jgi:hypothetical protein